VRPPPAPRTPLAEREGLEPKTGTSLGSGPPTPRHSRFELRSHRALRGAAAELPQGSVCIPQSAKLRTRAQGPRLEAQAWRSGSPRLWPRMPGMTWTEGVPRCLMSVYPCLGVSCSSYSFGLEHNSQHAFSYRIPAAVARFPPPAAFGLNFMYRGLVAFHIKNQDVAESVCEPQVVVQVVVIVAATNFAEVSLWQARPTSVFLAPASPTYKTPTCTHASPRAPYVRHHANPASPPYSARVWQPAPSRSPPAARRSPKGNRKKDRRPPSDWLVAWQPGNIASWGLRPLVFGFQVVRARGLRLLEFQA